MRGERERRTSYVWENERKISERERSTNKGINDSRRKIDRSSLKNAGGSKENGGTSGKSDERTTGSKRGAERERLADIRSNVGEHSQLSERDCQK